MCIKSVKNMQFNGQIFKICNNIYFIESGCSLRLQPILQFFFFLTNFVVKLCSYLIIHYQSCRAFKQFCFPFQEPSKNLNLEWEKLCACTRTLLRGRVESEVSILIHQVFKKEDFPSFTLFFFFPMYKSKIKF